MTYEQPGRRPGTVTAAAVIVIVLYSLFALAALLGVVAGIWLASSSEALAQLQQNAPETLGPMLSFGGGAIIVIAGLLLAFSILMILFSVQALRGRNWARIVSTVFLALGVLGNLGGMTQSMEQTGGRTGGGLFGLVLMAVALLLYWLPPSNRWFSAWRARRLAATQPPPAQPPPTQPPSPGTWPG